MRRWGERGWHYWTEAAFWLVGGTALLVLLVLLTRKLFT